MFCQPGPSLPLRHGFVKWLKSMKRKKTVQIWFFQGRAGPEQ